MVHLINFCADKKKKISVFSYRFTPKTTTACCVFFFMSFIKSTFGGKWNKRKNKKTAHKRKDVVAHSVCVGLGSTNPV